MMKPTYFDLTVSDLDAARRFFERVLQWRFERFPMPYEYYRIQAGPAEEAGIDGGVGSIRDAPVEPKMPIPGIGWYATCAEPGGLLFGLIQADPNTGAA
jgi:hypothetical protein